VYPDATGAILQEMEDAVHVEVRPLRVSRVVQPCGSMQARIGGCGVGMKKKKKKKK
jgi:hypothetical protein